MVPPCSDRISRVPPYSRIFDTLRIRGYHPLWPDFPDRSAYPPLTTGLFRFRSPLLAESLLMSVPPGTEMFQFPGFASSTYEFSERYPLPGGLPHSDIHGSTPARGSPWLFAACHVLHRLLVPRHPPNALLIRDTPEPNPKGSGPHHAQKPSSDPLEAKSKDNPAITCLRTHTQQIHPRQPPQSRSRRTRTTPSDKSSPRP